MHLRHHCILILIVLLLESWWAVTPPATAHAQSDELAWKPYLQQLTPTSVIICWATKTSGQPLVRYSTDTSYGETAHGNSSHIKQLNLYLHRVKVAGLAPDTTYYYQIAFSKPDRILEEQLSFHTAPPLGSDKPFQILIFGDYGFNTDSQRQLRDQMERDSFDLILTTGDNAYDNGSYDDFNRGVFKIYADVFARAPVYPALGNHDMGTDDGQPYLNLFELPEQAWRIGDEERYYAFDYGNTHIVVLDSNAALDVDDSKSANDMLDWLREDLRQTTQRWKIVTLHHPAFSTGEHESDERVQSKLIPIFEQYDVDLVLTGHDHSYQRTKPLRGGQVTTIENGGIVYIVTGAGGKANDPCTDAEWTAFSACFEDSGIYNRISVTSEYLRIEAIDDAGAVKDHTVIQHPHPANQQPAQQPLAVLPLFSTALALLGLGLVMSRVYHLKGG